jgi:DNA (cytosine-5)-methyltransferase 1
MQLTMHDATKHSERMLEIIRKSGYSRYDLPKGLTNSGFSSSYSRIEPDIPSVTLTVNFVHPASNKCIHPYQNRALTPREGARLQGFEDNYIFIGSRAQIVRQIGNAVPPLLGKAIAQALLEHI